MEVDLSRFPLENYNDHKYEGQASEYGSCVTEIDTTLNDVYTELSKVDEMLGIDPESAKDMLSYNVIVCNQEIKDEITALCAGLEGYSSVMLEKGKEIDKDKAIVKQEEAISQERTRLRALESEETSDDGSGDIEG